MAAQPVAVRLDELPAKVCGSKRLHSAGCQHGHCSATVYILRNQWSACRSCRRAQSSFSCSPAQRLQRPSLCRQCAGAQRFLLSIMYGACRAAHEALMQQAVQGGPHKTILDGNQSGPRHQFVASAGAAWCAPFLAVLPVVSPEVCTPLGSKFWHSLTPVLAQVRWRKPAPGGGSMCTGPP